MALQDLDVAANGGSADDAHWQDTDEPQSAACPMGTRDRSALDETLANGLGMCGFRLITHR
jgi:hypothetical protein